MTFHKEDKLRLDAFRGELNPGNTVTVLEATTTLLDNPEQIGEFVLTPLDLKGTLSVWGRWVEPNRGPHEDAYKHRESLDTTTFNSTRVLDVSKTVSTEPSRSVLKFTTLGGLILPESHVGMDIQGKYQLPKYFGSCILTANLPIFGDGEGVQPPSFEITPTLG